jgi:hypothetical protein
MAERHNVRFAVIYGLDLEEAAKIDAYIEAERYFQPANFILRDGRVVQAT